MLWILTIPDDQKKVLTNHAGGPIAIRHLPVYTSDLFGLVIDGSTLSRTRTAQLKVVKALIAQRNAPSAVQVKTPKSELHSFPHSKQHDRRGLALSIVIFSILTARDGKSPKLPVHQECL